MGVEFSQLAIATAETGILGLNLGAFLIQLLTFLIVFLALRRWAFGPILKKLDERRELIESGVSLGEEMKAKRAQLSEEVAKQLQAAREQADAVLTASQADARKVIEEAEAAAAARTEAIVKSAHRQIQITAERERAQLETQLVGLVADVSAAVLGEKLEGKRDNQLINKALQAREKA